MFHNFLLTMAPLQKWHEFKKRYDLFENHCFQWMQLINPFQKSIVKKTYENATNLIIYDHHLIKGPRVITFRKTNILPVTDTLP